MASNSSRFAFSTVKFREKYRLPTDSDVKKWFPRHMFASLQHMRAKLRSVDAVVEVHDARIPFTGRNPVFKQTLYNVAKPHVLVLNKKDLIGESTMHNVGRLLKRSDPELRRVVWTNCKHSPDEDMRSLMDVVKEAVVSTPRYNREYVSDYTLLIIGIPNVGKSSLINAIRAHTFHLRNKPVVTAVGATPGVTRAVMNKITVSERPKIFLIDTPGVVSPELTDDEDAMKLALCETVAQSAVSHEHLADFLLYFLNKRRNFAYVQRFDLDEPCEDIYKLLCRICLTDSIVQFDKRSGKVKPDVHGAANLFLSLFRNGTLSGSDQFLDWDALHKLDDQCAEKAYPKIS